MGCHAFAPGHSVTNDRPNLGASGHLPAVTDVSAIVGRQGVDPERSALVIVNLETREQWVSNAPRVAQRFSPASTSKIPHTLIALETGFATGPEQQFKWDGTKRMASAWNRDQTLKSAFQVSAVWVFQEIAAGLGQERMRYWLEIFDYGNHQIGSEEDLTTYWLQGPLAISAREQVVLLEKVARRRLPLKPETYHDARQIMLVDKRISSALFAKTGWYFNETQTDIGWYVGWLETGEATFVFGFNMDMPNPKQDRHKRRSTVEAVLSYIGATP